MCCFYNQEETWWWLKIRLFYFSAVLGLPCCAWASRCNGFCCRAQALGHAGSRHAGAAVLVQGLSCSVARGIFPDQGSNWCPLQCKAHLKPLDHKGSPGKIPFKRRTVYSVIEIRIFSTHTKVLFQVIPKTTKNEMKAPGHLRSPKTSTRNKAHQRTKPHAGWRCLPRGPSRTCDGVDNGSKDGGRLYQFFEDVRLGSQWEPIVQHLFQHLVNHDHIVFYHWLWTDSKIILMKTQYTYTFITQTAMGEGTRPEIIE